MLGASNEVSHVAANIYFHFLLLGPFAQVHSRELMEGQVTVVRSQDVLSHPSNS